MVPHWQERFTGAADIASCLLHCMPLFRCGFGLLVFHEDFPFAVLRNEQPFKVNVVMRAFARGIDGGIMKDTGFMSGGVVSQALGEAKLNLGLDLAGFGVRESRFPVSQRFGEWLARAFDAGDEHAFCMARGLVALKISLVNRA